MSARVRAIAASAAVLLLALAPVPATAIAWPDVVSGRLGEIKERNVVRLGYRDDAVPFSYVGPDGKPAGYSLDICHAIVAAIADELSAPRLAVEYVRVTAGDRIARVRAGAVDFECGATTTTAERRREVAFSPLIFVTGTRLAVPRDSRVRGADDLAGRSVAVVRGTTNEAAMHELDRRRGTRMAFVATTDYREALDLLRDHAVEALAADEILLKGLLAATGRSRELRIVGPMLSFEPYAIAYPRDDHALAEIVERTFRTLAESRELVWIYNRWFVRPLPSGPSLDLPMSDVLRRSLEVLGLPPD